MMEEYFLLCPWRYVFSFLDHYTLCNSTLVCKNWLESSLPEWISRCTGFLEDYSSTSTLFPKKYLKMSRIKTNWSSKKCIASAHTLVTANYCNQYNIPSRFHPLFTSLSLPIYQDSSIDVRARKGGVVVKNMQTKLEHTIAIDWKADWSKAQYDPASGWLAILKQGENKLNLLDVTTGKIVRSLLLMNSRAFHIDSRLDLIIQAYSTKEYPRYESIATVSKFSSGALISSSQFGTAGYFQPKHVAFNGLVILISDSHFKCSIYVLDHSLKQLYVIGLKHDISELQVSDSKIIMGTDSTTHMIDFDCGPDYKPNHSGIRGKLSVEEKELNILQIGDVVEEDYEEDDEELESWDEVSEEDEEYKDEDEEY